MLSQSQFSQLRSIEQQHVVKIEHGNVKIKVLVLTLRYRTLLSVKIITIVPDVVIAVPTKHII
jgi:hypothetical protein